MSTTQELVERLKMMADTKGHEAYNANAWEPPPDILADAADLRAAAARLSELERENARLRAELGGQ
jgi:hypothetical protein